MNFTNNGSFDINDNTNNFSQFKEILNSNNFITKLPFLGTHEIDSIIYTLIDNIETNISLKKYKNIEDIFIDHFQKYLNNRIGTNLLITEKEIVNNYYRPNLIPGKLLIYKYRFDLYMWVIYKEKSTTRNKHIIILREDDGKYNIKEIHENKLIGFPPNEKINLNNITDQHIIEKYFFNNIQ